MPPKCCWACCLYGYATGVFSSRKIERATYEAVPFRFIAGNLHPDHDTLATFRRTFLPELKELFVQVLLLAQEAGVLKLGTISLDGTKIHADASKHKAVSYKRLLEIGDATASRGRGALRSANKASSQKCPMGWWCARRSHDGRTAWRGWRRPKRCWKLVPQERAAAEQAEYEAKLAQRAERERTTGADLVAAHRAPPVPGPRDGDQYNFTDPESRIMKNPTDAGFEQDYNAQVAVDQAESAHRGMGPLQSS